MTSTDKSAPWPDEEQLAAFIDGQLQGAERQEVERQIAASPECAEWVAEVLALEAEDDEEGADQVQPAASNTVVDATPRFPRSATTLLAAAAVLVLSLPLIFALRDNRDSLDSDAMLAFLPRGDRLERALDDGWFNHTWSVMRGEGGPTAAPPIAFQLGVRAVDLATALRAGKVEDSRILIARAEALLNSAEGADFLALALLRVGAALEEVPPDVDAAREGTLLFEESLADVEPQNAVLVGKWAGAGNAALVAEAEIFFKSRHWSEGLDLLATDGSDPRLQDLAAELRETRSGDLPGLRAKLDEIVALLGNGDARVGAD